MAQFRNPACAIGRNEISLLAEMKSIAYRLQRFLEINNYVII